MTSKLRAEFAPPERPTCADDIQLGAVYRDQLTEFLGVAIGTSQWVTGCDTVGLSRILDGGAGEPTTHWFDVNRLSLVGSERPWRAPVQMDRTAPAGGPQTTPQPANPRGSQ